MWGGVPSRLSPRLTPGFGRDDKGGHDQPPEGGDRPPVNPGPPQASHLVIPEAPQALSGTGRSRRRAMPRTPARPWASGGGCGSKGRGGWSKEH